MTRAKSSKNKDDNKNKKSLNKGLKRNSKKDSRSLKSLGAVQAVTPVPKDKSLNSLKKIKKQLNKILSSRDAEQQQLNALQARTTELSQQLELTESHLSQFALNDDIQKITDLLDKQKRKFKKKIQRISSETSLFKDLSRRVEKKIQTLESLENQPSADDWQHLTEQNNRLHKKIRNFEETLRQFSDTYITPEPDNEKLAAQLTQLSNTVSQLNQQLTDSHQAHDTQIKLLQTDTGNIRKSLQRDIKNHQQLIDNHHQGMKSLKQKISSLKENVEKHQQKLKNIDDSLSADTAKNTAAEDYQQLLIPLENHLESLENKVQQLQQEYRKQPLETELETEPDADTDKNTELQALQSQQQAVNAQVEQFNEQLRQTQEDFKQQVQQLSDTADQTGDNQFAETLAQLTAKITVVSEQADSLQTLFNTLQEQQNTENAHHDELSKQYLSQQQQLEKHNTQLLELLPAMAQSEQHEQQLQQLSESLADLTQQQTSPDEAKNGSEQYQESIDTLFRRQDEIESHQREVESHQQDIESHQQDVESRQQDVESHQQEMASHQHALETSHLKLDQRQNDIENHHLDVETQQRKIVSYQQDQGVALNQLEEQLKSRSRWFAVGLLTVLAVSTLLFFNQEQLQAINNSEHEQALIDRLKTEVTNETFTKINALTKQNSNIINQQFTQIRKSIEQVKQESQANLKTNPQNSTPADSAQLDNLIEKKLEDRLEAKITPVITTELENLKASTEKTQKDQQALDKTVQQLAAQVSRVNQQLEKIKQTVSQQSTDRPVSAIHYAGSTIPIIQLAASTPEFYSIQLLGARQKQSLVTFLMHNSFSAAHKIYQVKLQDKPWYIIVQGHYASFAQAKEKLQQLPEALRKNGPWVKKLP